MLAACTHKPRPAVPQSPIPQSPISHPPIEGALVGPGLLAEPDASVSLDLLLPADAEIPVALDHARTEMKAAGFSLVTTLPDHPTQPMITIELESFSDLGWSGKKPRYIEAWLKEDELQQVYASVGIVRLKVRGPSNRALDSLTRLLNACRTFASAHKAWIFDSYRAQLHTADSLDGWMPDPKDVETIVRVMGVTSKNKPSHARTIGFARLGLPELYIPAIIPEADLSAARYLLFGAAQTFLKSGGITRRGQLDVDMTSITPEWNPAEHGSGKFGFEARWVRGPIHEKLIIELSLRGGSRDPAAFASALRRFAVVDQE